MSADIATTSTFRPTLPSFSQCTSGAQDT